MITLINYNENQIAKFKESWVKSFLRKGRLVKQHKRKNKIARNIAIGTVGIAGLVGLAPLSYLALKARYKLNMPKILNSIKAKASKINPNLDSIVGKKDVMYIVPGFVGANHIVEHKAKLMTWAENQYGKSHHIVMTDIDGFNPKIDNRTNPKRWFLEIGNLFRKNAIRGNNPIADNLSAEMLAVKQKYGDKIKVSAIGLSGGGMILSDVNEHLTKLNVPHKVIALAAPHGGFNSNNNSNYVSIGHRKDPLLKMIAPNKNTQYITDTDGKHTMDSYGNSKQLKAIVDRALFS